MDQSTTPPPSPALLALDRLVGTWKVAGDAEGTVTYRWVLGGYFLHQDVDLHQFGQHVTGFEVIGNLSLQLLIMCAHPDLTPASQIALTLRAVGGLTTAEIASAFLVPESTVAQRISRAKARIRDAGAIFGLPEPEELPNRLRAVHQVLYLIFNEGYLASSGEHVVRTDLSAEAIRLTRRLHTTRPGDADTVGLLALMLLIDARRAARIGPGGIPIPLAEQDRTRWNQPMITEGADLAVRAMTLGPLGSYQVQAAIAALHDQATTAADTDWPQILGLYTLLERLDASPMVPLNRAVAVAMVHCPDAGLHALDALTGNAATSPDAPNASPRPSARDRRDEHELDRRPRGSSPGFARSQVLRRTTMLPALLRAVIRRVASGSVRTWTSALPAEVSVCTR